eukprot:Clim_evm22s232 gene=Clim_evmTU22s232
MEIKSIADLDRDPWWGRAADLLNSEWPRSKSTRIASLERIVSGNGADHGLPAAWVGIIEGEVVAFTQLSPTTGTAGDGEVKITTCAIMENLVVSKSKRGQKLGKGMLEFAEDHCRRHAVGRLQLSTTTAEDFYRRCGYIDGARDVQPRNKVLARFGRGDGGTGDAVPAFLQQGTESSGLTNENRAWLMKDLL